MWSTVKSYLSKAYAFAKRVFGHSRTIFLNVVGVLGVVFTESADTLTGIDWDALFKHEVAVGIGITVQFLNVLLRLDTSTPVSFAKVPEPDPVVPVAEEEVPPSPKAL